MGRRLPLRPLPQPAQYDQALLEAVQGALAALSAAGKEATPSDIEEWLKINQHAVWSAIRTPSALKGAIEAAQREQTNGRPAVSTKGASAMTRKKKEQRESPPERPAKAQPRPQRTARHQP